MTVVQEQIGERLDTVYFWCLAYGDSTKNLGALMYVAEARGRRFRASNCTEATDSVPAAMPETAMIY